MDEQLLVAVERATRILRKHFYLARRPPLEIQSNDLYDVWVAGRHLIAKRFLKADELTVAPAREHSALELLAAYDIAPQPIFYDPAVAPVVIYEYLEGEMWDRCKPTATQLAQLAQLWLTMHSVPTTNLWLSRGWERTADEVIALFRAGFDRYAAWSAAQFPPGQAAVQPCMRLVDQVEQHVQTLAKADPPLAFCRADPRFANVIERPDGRLAYVDWEDSGLRDPARDLADLLTHPNQEDLLTQDEWQAFLQPYLAERSMVDPTLQQRVHAYLAIFPLFWLAILLPIGVKRATAGTVGTWQINELPANLRLQRYLARAMAWPNWDFVQELAEVNTTPFFPRVNDSLNQVRTNSHETTP